MNLKTHLSILLLLGLLILFDSCENKIAKPIPEKHPEISQGKYDRYLSQLEKAYTSNDNFEAARILANLKADKSITFQLLDLSVEEDPNRCYDIYEWYWLYDRHDFGVNILKLDTVLFKETMRLCEEKYKTHSYQAFAKMKDEEERHAEEVKQIEDTTHFNMELVAELKQILEDDQRVRIKRSAKNITPELKKELGFEMHRIDSINLLKIDKIFKEYGYPSRDLVGKDGNFTPALVIHHSNSLETRYKYLPFLEKAVEDRKLHEGTLGMIKRRIENMELDRK